TALVLKNASLIDLTSPEELHREASHIIDGLFRLLEQRKETGGELAGDLGMIFGLSPDRARMLAHVISSDLAQLASACRSSSNAPRSAMIPPLLWLLSKNITCEKNLFDQRCGSLAALTTP